MALQKVKHYSEILKLAKLYEADGELEKAAKEYEQVIKQHALEERAYARLMVIYRRLKDPKKELKILNKGIEAFKAFHDQKLSAYSGNNAVGKLSKALMKSLSGKTKIAVEYPKPIPAWIKRKETLESKM